MHYELSKKNVNGYKAVNVVFYWCFIYAKVQNNNNLCMYVSYRIKNKAYKNLIHVLAWWSSKDCFATTCNYTLKRKILQANTIRKVFYENVDIWYFENNS